MFLNGKDKRIKILITAVILLCLLTACGLGGKKNSGNTPSAQGTQQSQQTQQTQMPIAGGFTAVETDELPF